ncbi:MAG: hypothetical protein IT425_03500 [Pirellulales bacterium]|nr:hypothetical protein [Pirellulales bacterium]
MNTLNDEQLEWRDTYFVLFNEADRPTVTQVEAAITEASRQLKLQNLEGDEDGMFESVFVEAPQDNAALEVNFEHGEAVSGQSVELAKQMKGDLSAKHLQLMLKADARLDIMMFERVRNSYAADQFDDEDDWESNSLDPSSLLNVVTALAKLTRGLPIDPASGTVLT